LGSAITLTMRPAREFRDVAQLVVGGVAARLELTVEHLEDLEIALGELLARHDDESPLTLELSFDEERLEATVGPFDHDALASELEDGHGLGLRRVLSALVDGAELDTRDGEGWLRLTKVIEREAV
jgi:anti-sigma regulatory factor (Ser/Thr protein kinase)